MNLLWFLNVLNIKTFLNLKIKCYPKALIPVTSIPVISK